MFNFILNPSFSFSINSLLPFLLSYLLWFVRALSWLLLISLVSSSSSPSLLSFGGESFSGHHPHSWVYYRLIGYHYCLVSYSWNLCIKALTAASHSLYIWVLSFIEGSLYRDTNALKMHATCLFFVLNGIALTTSFESLSVVYSTQVLLSNHSL